MHRFLKRLFCGSPRLCPPPRPALLRRPTRRSGFSLVEITAVAVVIGILVGSVVLLVSSSRQQTLSARVESDIESIDMAKHLWQLDYSKAGLAFPTTESARFTAIQPYLQSQRPLNSISDMEPPGVTYTIGPLGSSATATGL